MQLLCGCTAQGEAVLVLQDDVQLVPVDQQTVKTQLMRFAGLRKRPAYCDLYYRATVMKVDDAAQTYTLKYQVSQAILGNLRQDQAISCL